MSLSRRVNKVLVLGFGQSAKSACKLLLDRGFKVKVSSLSEPQDSDSSILQRLQDAEFGVHTLQFAQAQDLIVTSPGIKESCPIIEYAHKNNIPVIDEIELGFLFCPTPNIIAVTGTNGKSTVAHYLYHILKGNNFKVCIGGNFSPPFTSLVDDLKPRSWVVLEVSSFQLKRTDKFRPHIGILLNVKPDHLDWHGDFQDYMNSKFNLFKNQTEEDFALINSQDRISLECVRDLRAQVIFFRENNYLNENFSSILECAKIVGLEEAKTLDLMKSIPPLGHRLELALRFRGRNFYNDSKSTNISSGIFALKTLRRDLVLICGGRSKGQDFSCLRSEPLFLERVKKVIVFGESAHLLEQALQGVKDVVRVKDIREAVEEAIKQGSLDVLFSPMCSSFDMFSDYKERGRVFKDIVRSLCGE